MQSWQGEVFKAIMFPVAVKRDAAELWHSIVGRTPDNSARKGLPPPLQSTASGDWDGFTLNILIQPARVEANLTAIDPTPSEPTPLPPIPADRVADAVERIKEVSSKLVTDHQIIRLGAASQLVVGVTDAAAGITVLNAELAGRFPDNADSPLFQLNVRRDLVACEGRMNRLCKWGVATVGTLGIAIQSGHVSSLHPEEPVTYAYSHLDMNNVPFTDPIGADGARALFSELWDEEAKLRVGGFDALT